MKTTAKLSVPVALQPEALLNKSKIYIRAGLDAKRRGNVSQYQLNGAIALELLAKAALSAIHPSLIVEHNNPNNILVAAGIHVDTAAKTIGAEDAYSRLRHVSRGFAACYEACKRLAQRRNAELHSAELPMNEMKPEAWEGDYWRAAEVILESCGLDLDDWLGANEAKPTKELIEETQRAKAEAAKARVAQASLFWQSLKAAEKQRREEIAKSASVLNIDKKFRLLLDTYWEHKCPACGNTAYIGGDKFIVEESAEYVGDGWENVDIDYVGEEFYCPACELQLEGTEILDAAGIESTHSDTLHREVEYEPDYGNC